MGVAIRVVWRSALLLFAAAVAEARPASTPATDSQSPFLSVLPAVSDEFRFDLKSPEFEAQDINGRTWRSEDLRGKFTLIYLY
ncbi:MAG TPA: hypothetical protein VG096_13020 [Bryobacteraceae bacterium]|jgi:cytochrome oxidase Cu insertion factor (SCO1/SenC/PrrC family)|nr:hypothetical protein [Bryobacteraceae bacterium]